MLRFKHPARGILTVTVKGITYTATHYPSGGKGTRAYWTIQASNRDYSEGNDWYEPSEQRVRESLQAYTGKL